MLTCSIVRAGFGHGGWVCIHGLDTKPHEIWLPGVLYVRVREAERRMRICELYLDASDGPNAITAGDLRNLPLADIEAFINEHADHVRKWMDTPAPDLSTLATHYATTFDYPRGVEERNWVAISFASQFDQKVLDAEGLAAPRVRKSRHRVKGVMASDRDFRLPPLYDAGANVALTDSFLDDVARAYRAALARGEKPNVALAEQTGYPLGSVRRWVYTARQRGRMPAGVKGRAG